MKKDQEPEGHYHLAVTPLGVAFAPVEGWAEASSEAGAPLVDGLPAPAIQPQVAYPCFMHDLTITDLPRIGVYSG